MLKWKIVLAGAKDVGKSSLIARFCDNIFNEEMMDTIGVAFKRKKISPEGTISIDLNIWDFGGEERYRSLFPSYVNGAAGALILYDITDEKSFEDVQNWVTIIDENQEGVVKMIIGTKADLEDQREISIELAKEKSETFDLTGDPIETSAKTGKNVEEAFLRLAEEITKRKLQLCGACGEIYDKKLKFCRHCGEKSEMEVVL
ncbi:MAG: GTP-binding protein [Promethearchaeota archaeon]|nr:MAG: GTP-binding protein [Candidatus Lokiarchaeota archaeon]